MSSNPPGGLGLRIIEDPDDHKYPLRALLPTAPEPGPPERYWTMKPALDQGQLPRCVGYATRQWLSSSPVPDPSGPDQDTLYFEAQKRDEWPGEGYDGTSDRGSMKYLQELGYIEEYRWSSRAEEGLAFVLTRGTLLLGIPWLAGMDEPDKEGIIRATGAERGGHEILVAGASRTRGLFRLLNSWGPGWGQNGRAWISGEDLQALLDRRGSLLCPVQAPRKGR